MSRQIRHRAHRLEKYHEPLPTQSLFLVRQLLFFVSACIGLSAWLMLGAWLFQRIYGHDWLNSFYNASMLLVGQGPPSAPPTVVGTLAISAYAVISAIAVITSCGIILYPAWHRLQHRAHLDG